MAASIVARFVAHALTVVGAVTVFITYLVLYDLRREGRTVMHSFRRDPTGTQHDFELLFTGNIVLFLLFGLYLVGGLLNHPTWFTGARVLEVVFVSILAIILYRWWRRFRST